MSLPDVYAVGVVDISHARRGRRHGLDLNVAHLDGVAGGVVGLAKLEPQHQRAIVLLRREAVADRLLLATREGLVKQFAIRFPSVAVVADLICLLVLLALDVEGDDVLLSNLRRDASVDEELGVPNVTHVLRGFGDGQRRALAIIRDALGVTVVMFLGHVLVGVIREALREHADVLIAGIDGRRTVGEPVGKDVRVLEVDSLQAEVPQRDGVARSGVRLAELEANRQRTVALLGVEDHVDVVRATSRQAAAVQRAIGVLDVAVEANLVVRLVAFGIEVELESIVCARIERHAGSGIELGLPHAAVVRVGRRLRDGHGRAARAFLKVNDVAIVMLLIHCLNAAVEGGRQRDVLIGHGDGLVDDRAGHHGLIQRKAFGQHVGVLVNDLVHVDVAHDDQRSATGLAERELEDELVAVAIASDHCLAGLHLTRNQLLAIESAIALLDVAVVEKELERNVALVAVNHHISGDAIVGALLGDQAGPHVELGLPNTEVEWDGLVVDVDRVVSSHENRLVARIMTLVDARLPLEVHRRGQGVLIRDLVRVLLHLDIGEVDGEGRQHTKLKIKIARAVLGGEGARDAVLAFLDLELLEVAELDRTGHVGGEVVGHGVITARDGGVVCLELDMPRLSVGLRGNEMELAADGSAAARDRVALELGLEQVGLHLGLRHLPTCSLLLRSFGWEVLERIRVRQLSLSLLLWNCLLLCGHGQGTATNQERSQKHDCNHDSRAFHYYSSSREANRLARHGTLVSTSIPMFEFDNHNVQNVNVSEAFLHIIAILSNDEFHLFLCQYVFWCICKRVFDRFTLLSR